MGIDFIFVPENKISVVVRVKSGGLAEKQGMKYGDVLLDNEGTALSRNQLLEMWKNMPRPFSMSFAVNPVALDSANSDKFTNTPAKVCSKSCFKFTG